MIKRFIELQKKFNLDKQKNLAILISIIKVVQVSKGQYIDGSGAEPIWTKNDAFGVNVEKQVVNSMHCKKSLYSLFVSCETI